MNKENRISPSLGGVKIGQELFFITNERYVNRSNRICQTKNKVVVKGWVNEAAFSMDYSEDMNGLLGCVLTMSFSFENKKNDAMPGPWLVSEQVDARNCFTSREAAETTLATSIEVEEVL